MTAENRWIIAVIDENGDVVMGHNACDVHDAKAVLCKIIDDLYRDGGMCKLHKVDRLEVRRVVDE